MEILPLHPKPSKKKHMEKCLFIYVYIYIYIWVFPKIGVGPQNGWFIMVPNPIKMDDLGVPLFLETPI